MPVPSEASNRFDRRAWLWLVAIWAIAVVTMWLRMSANSDGPLLNDTDDAMRMVVVRDFLAGQGWYDLTQHRLNTPFGAEIHWSRLIDMPLAGLLALASLFTTPANATAFVGIVWPLALLVILLYLSARITLELVGRDGLLPALVLPVLSPAILAEFSPGRLDHHNVISLLTLGTLLTTLLALRRPKMAIAAGLTVTIGMGIAVEILPVAIAAVLALGLAYVVEPKHRRTLGFFGAAFAGGMALSLALVRPPSRWLEAACDMISPAYVLAGLTVGAAYIIVAALPAPRRAWQRFLLLAGLGIVAAGIVVLAYPQCLRGPYGELDPWLQANWLAAVGEAKPWHAVLGSSTAYALAVGIPALLALVIAVIALIKSVNRLNWLTLLVFLVLLDLVFLAQIRGARLAVIPALPAAAWLIVMARRAYVRRPSLATGSGLLGGWLAFSGLIIAMIVVVITNLTGARSNDDDGFNRGANRACLAADAFVDLAPLPPERVMTPVDLGAHMLLETNHAVVSAPYHRNEQGVLDTFAFFNGSAEAAREIARERGLGLLVTCPTMPEMKGLPDRAEPAMVDLLRDGPLPEWLEDVSLEGPLRVYAILP